MCEICEWVGVDEGEDQFLTVEHVCGFPGKWCDICHGFIYDFSIEDNEECDDCE